MKKLLFLNLAMFISLSGWAKEYKLQVNSGDYERINCIVKLDVTDIVRDQSNVVLYELSGRKKNVIDCQVVPTDNGRKVLIWMLNGKMPPNTLRSFKLDVKKNPLDNSNFSMLVVDDTKSLLLKNNGSGILQYNYEVTYPPKGVNEAYKRSGYIHPAFSPKGNVLTTIQPKDHYHHYGIWNPWTRIEYDGEVYDLWNLADKKGTVRAEEITKTFEGNIGCGFTANLGHYIFKPDGEKKIIDEQWSIVAWNTSDGFLWDFASALKPSTETSVLLKAYRYAGFGWRATEDWTKDNCVMFTSEGKERKDIDGSTAKWIFVTGECGNNGKSGLLILAHPANFNSPEPLRIWNESANSGRGDAFVNFAPTKNKDWELLPDKSYSLRYRLFAYDGDMNETKAQSLWQDFAYPPMVVFLD